MLHPAAGRSCICRPAAATLYRPGVFFFKFNGSGCELQVVLPVVFHFDEPSFTACLITGTELPVAASPSLDRLPKHLLCDDTYYRIFRYGDKALNPVSSAFAAVNHQGCIMYRVLYYVPDYIILTLMIPARWASENSTRN